MDKFFLIEREVPKVRLHNQFGGTNVLLQFDMNNINVICVLHRC